MNKPKSQKYTYNHININEVNLKCRNYIYMNLNIF